MTSVSHASSRSGSSGDRDCTTRTNSWSLGIWLGWSRVVVSKARQSHARARERHRSAGGPSLRDGISQHGRATPAGLSTDVLSSYLVSAGSITHAGRTARFIVGQAFVGGEHRCEGGLLNAEFSFHQQQFTLLNGRERDGSSTSAQAGTRGCAAAKVTAPNLSQVSPGRPLPSAGRLLRRRCCSSAGNRSRCK